MSKDKKRKKRSISPDSPNSQNEKRKLSKKSKKKKKKKKRNRSTSPSPTSDRPVFDVNKHLLPSSLQSLKLTSSSKFSSFLTPNSTGYDKIERYENVLLYEVN